MKLFVVSFIALVGVALGSNHKMGHKGRPAAGLGGGTHGSDHRRVFRGNNLVTLRPRHLISMMQCAKSDDNLCREFNDCELLASKTPVLDAVTKCQQIQIPHRTRKCYYSEPEFQEHGAELELFNCVTAKTQELTPEEKRDLVAFEDCARDFLTHECGAPKMYYTGQYRTAKKSMSLKDMHFLDN